MEDPPRLHRSMMSGRLEQDRSSGRLDDDWLAVDLSMAPCMFYSDRYTVWLQEWLALTECV